MACILCGLITATVSSSSRAQSGTVQAISGGAALGAEIVVIGEALGGVRGNWWYAAGAVVGSAGGGTAGYYLGKGNSHYLPSFLIAGGFALFIPAMLGLASSQYYQPPSELPNNLRVDLASRLSFPTIAVGGSYTLEERHLFGVAESSDFTIYLLNGAF